MLSSNENIIQIVREASVFIMEVWGLIMACDIHTALFCSLIKEVKTEFARGPGGVIHAISPIWMKLCQIEGTTKQL